MTHKHKWQLVTTFSYGIPKDLNDTYIKFVCDCGKTKIVELKKKVKE